MGWGSRSGATLGESRADILREERKRRGDDVQQESVQDAFRSRGDAARGGDDGDSRRRDRSRDRDRDRDRDRERGGGGGGGGGGAAEKEGADGSGIESNPYFQWAKSGGRTPFNDVPEEVPDLAEDVPDHWSRLGVYREATTKEIQRNFRLLSVRLHPDKNPGNEKASRLYMAITEAYSYLEDDEKREKYDLRVRKAQRGIGRGFDPREWKPAKDRDPNQSGGSKGSEVQVQGAYGASDRDLRSLFRCCGTIEKIYQRKLHIKAPTFIKFQDGQAADVAVARCDGKRVGGQKIKVLLADGLDPRESNVGRRAGTPPRRRDDTPPRRGGGSTPPRRRERF